jgi:hypothetical protein
LAGPPDPEASIRRGSLLTIGLGVVLLVGSISLIANLPKRPLAMSAVGPTASASPSQPAASPEPSPAAVAASSSARLGQAVAIAYKGVESLKVTVATVRYAAFYRDPGGRYTITPASRGAIFMAVLVMYTATGPNADYNPGDWAIAVNELPGPPATFVFYGPKPVLQSRRLAEGRSAQGWIIYEVPVHGRITISYQPRRSPSIFVVPLRAS